MKFHPYSELFPLIEGAEFDELVADIRENGLREPIVVYKGQVLDGRNRFLACHKIGIKAKTREFKGDPLAFVISSNVHRRHLSASQRAMVAGRISNLEQGSNQHSDAKQVRPIGPTSAALNVGERSVKRARKVLAEGSKALQAAVERDEVSVNKAASVVDLPKSEQLAAATKKPDDEAPPEKWEPDADDEAMEAQFEKDYAASMDKVMAADDKLAAAHLEIKRQAAEIASLKMSRDGFMNGRTEALRLLKKVQSKNLRLEKELEGIRGSRAA